MNQTRYYKITDVDGQSVTFYKQQKIAEIGDTEVSIEDLDVDLLSDRLAEIDRIEGTTSVDSDFHKTCRKIKNKLKRDRL